MRRALFLVAIVGCAHVDSVKSQPDTVETQPKPGPPAASLSFAQDAPKGGSGACRGGSDPMQWTEPDGLGGDDTKLPVVKPTPMPPWNLDRMRDFACFHAHAPAGSAAHLLAWKIDAEGGNRTHDALLAVEHAILGPKKWTIVLMTRHASNDYWRLPVIWDSPARPIHDFGHAPTDADVGDVLRDNRWALDTKTILAGNVIQPLWKDVTGAQPK